MLMTYEKGMLAELDMIQLVYNFALVKKKLSFQLKKKVCFTLSW